MSEISKKTGRVTLLDKGCEFNGKLTFEGTVRIDGKFQGEIYSEDTLIIGEGSHVEGEINVADVEISGNFKGNIHAKNLIHTHPPAHIEGMLRTPRLIVEDGVVIEGQCQMGGRDISKERAADPSAPRLLSL